MINPKYSETSRSDQFIPFQCREKRIRPQPIPKNTNLSLIQPSPTRIFPRSDPETRSNAENKDFHKQTRKPVTLRDLNPTPPDTPKLRETNSTKCQSPKATSIARTKVQEFQRIRLLGRGKFGDVYLVKYYSSYSGTEGQGLSLHWKWSVSWICCAVVKRRMRNRLRSWRGKWRCRPFWTILTWYVSMISSLMRRTCIFCWNWHAMGLYLNCSNLSIIFRKRRHRSS